MPGPKGSDNTASPPQGQDSPAPVAGESLKRWMRLYRTELAAASSSVLSTGAAVGNLWLAAALIRSRRSVC